VLKSSTKSEEQILFEGFLQKEENLKRILNEREDIIALNEKNINDLRNKLQVKLVFFFNKCCIYKGKIELRIKRKDWATRGCCERKDELQ